MTNNELTFEQMQTMNGGVLGIVFKVAKAWMETNDEIDCAKETGKLPERVFEPIFVEKPEASSVKEGCEDPQCPCIG